MGIRGIALFFASHRCNSVCHQLGLTPFAHSPMPGDGAATEYGRDVDAAPDEDVVIRAEPSSLVLAVGKGNNSRAEIYRHVHFALAMLHARHVQVNAEFIGHNVLTSPAQGLFHLQVSAQLGSIPGALALACLHLSIRPRKGVLRALGTSLQRPLTLDESAAFPYILQAAESGVAKAMAAAAYAYERGLGCAVSATDAVFWYRKALTALSTQEDDTEEDREAERLPGGSLEQSEILRALAHLYELGGGGLAPNPRLAWQFQVLSNNRARLESATSCCKPLRRNLPGLTAMALPSIVTVQTALDKLCKQTAGMQRIVVTDKDGVEVLKAGDKLDHDASATSIITTIFSQTAQQSEKVAGLGKTQSILLTYDKCYVLQVGMEMLVISILASRDAKIGPIMALVPSLKELLAPTQLTVKRETELTDKAT